MADLGPPIRDETIHRTVLAFSAALILLAFLLSLPIVYTFWTGKLSAEGGISLAGWDQSISTPSPTPYLPVKDGTSLSAAITANGFYLNTGDNQVEAGANDRVEPRTGVRGAVCVFNQGRLPTENLFINSIIQSRDEKGAPFKDFYAFTLDISNQPDVDPGVEICYPYAINFLPPQKTILKYRLTAEVTIHNHVDWMPGTANCPGPQACPFGPSVYEDFKLPMPVPVETVLPIHPPIPNVTSTATEEPQPSTTLVTTASPVRTSLPHTETATETTTPTPTPSLTPADPEPTSPFTPTQAPTQGIALPSGTPTPAGTSLPDQPTPSPTLTPTATSSQPVATPTTPPASTATPTVTPPPILDLSITQTGGDLPAAPGEVVPYILTFANKGNLPASIVELTEVLPLNTIFNPEASSPGWSPVKATSQYIYLLGDLPPGVSGSVVFAVTINDPFPLDMDHILNTATIHHLAPDDPDSNPSNNTATETTPILTAPLQE